MVTLPGGGGAMIGPMYKMGLNMAAVGYICASHFFRALRKWTFRTHKISP